MTDSLLTAGANKNGRPPHVGGMADELEDLTSYVRKVKEDLTAIHPDSIRQLHIPGAAGQLEAIVQATEDSASKILDAGEALENVAREFPGAAAQRIRDAVTTIYEACNFHDLTGQRILKVMITLEYIEAKLANLMEMVGVGNGMAPPPKAAPAAPEALDDRALLNGPQLPGQGMDQSEIDKLLADFG